MGERRRYKPGASTRPSASEAASAYVDELTRLLDASRRDARLRDLVLKTLSENGGTMGIDELRSAVSAHFFELTEAVRELDEERLVQVEDEPDGTQVKRLTS